MTGSLLFTMLMTFHVVRYLTDATVTQRVAPEHLICFGKQPSSAGTSCAVPPARRYASTTCSAISRSWSNLFPVALLPCQHRVMALIKTTVLCHCQEQNNMSKMHGMGLVCTCTAAAAGIPLNDGQHTDGSLRLTLKEHLPWFS